MKELQKYNVVVIDKIIKNNKNIINIAGIIHDNRITELNEVNSLDVTLVHNKSLALIEYEMIE